MHTMTSSTSWFGARTVVSAVALVALTTILSAEAQSSDGCRVECYPNTKSINSKGAGKGENCRWILRTDGKAAKLCDHIKCKKICPNNQAASSAAQDQQVSASTVASDMRIEQHSIDGESSPSLAAPMPSGGESMGIMRQMHGSKLGRAPVPGVAGGRLSQPVATPPAASGSGRRNAPTLPPSVQYDENDTPPPIARFLDISPEE